MGIFKKIMNRFAPHNPAPKVVPEIVPEPTPPAPACLFFIEKTTEPGIERTVRDMTQERFTIGSAPDCDLHLSDPTDPYHQHLSRAHAQVAYVDSHWQLSALSQLCPTLVNGVALLPEDKPVTLSPGDLITLGRIELRFFLTADQLTHYILISAPEEDPREQVNTGEIKCSLTVEKAGPLDAELVGKTYVLMGWDFTIGRDEGCDLRVRDPRFDARHALLRGSSPWSLIIMGDSGLYRNGTRIDREGTIVLLYDGDELSLGDYIFRFHDPSEAARRDLAREDLPVPPEDLEADLEWRRQHHLPPFEDDMADDGDWFVPTRHSLGFTDLPLMSAHPLPADFVPPVTSSRTTTVTIQPVSPMALRQGSFRASLLISPGFTLGQTKILVENIPGGVHRLQPNMIRFNTELLADHVEMRPTLIFDHDQLYTVILSPMPPTGVENPEDPQLLHSLCQRFHDATFGADSQDVFPWGRVDIVQHHCRGKLRSDLVFSYRNPADSIAPQTPAHLQEKHLFSQGYLTIDDLILSGRTTLPMFRTFARDRQGLGHWAAEDIFQLSAPVNSGSVSLDAMLTFTDGCLATIDLTPDLDLLLPKAEAACREFLQELGLNPALTQYRWGTLTCSAGIRLSYGSIGYLDQR